MRRKAFVLLSLVTIVGFLANLVWENAQAPLYEGFMSFQQHFIICLIASVVDAGVVLLLYLAFVLGYGNPFWIDELNWKSSTLLIILGGIIAFGFEKHALSAGMWDYADGMPIIPVLKVGLSPMLQLMLLPVLTYYISNLVVKKAMQS